ncbi:hypothetical protein SUGI_1017100 [Cryptomeria japonica]|nr:hypothetical protein SUGI_1017100 [Cryptomeria japonica]
MVTSPKVLFPAINSQSEESGAVVQSGISDVDKAWIESEIQKSGAILFREFGLRVEDGGGKLQWMEENGNANIIFGPFPDTRSFRGYGDRKVWFNYIPAAMYGKTEARFNRLFCGGGSSISESVMKEREL